MMEIGTIFNYQGFSEFSGIDINVGWSISAGKLISPADTNKPLQFNYASALWEWKKTVVCNKKSLRLYSYMTALNFYGEFYINSENKLCSYFSYGSTTSVSTLPIGFNNGDLLEFSLLKSGWSLIFSVKNLTTNQVVNLDASNVIHATHKLRLITSEVTEVSSYKLESSQEQGGTIAVGDSITYGNSATTEANGWVRIANFMTEAGGGDRSADAVLLIPEIVNHIKPSRVIYAMGTNDGDINVWKANLVFFQNKMRVNRITFIPCAPYANNNKSMQPFKDYIIANYDVYFDFFELTKQDGNTNIKSNYDSGDGVHPNNFGHLEIGNFLLNNQFYNYFEDFSNNFLINLYHSILTSA